MGSKVIQGDIIDELKKYPDNHFDVCVGDPPYGIAFMGKSWDKYKPMEFQDWCYQWGCEILRVLKPGAFCLLFGGTRTVHRLGCALEDAGFNLKDTISWVYGSGFPKAQDLSKMIDKRAGVGGKVIGENKDAISKQNKIATNETQCPKSNPKSVGYITAPATPLAKQWDGYKIGGLKPAHEPIVLCQKPAKGPMIDNVLEWGCGAMNIEVGRVGFMNESDYSESVTKNQHADFNSNNGVRVPTKGIYHGDFRPPENYNPQSGRYPANLILECTCEEVVGGGEIKRIEYKRDKTNNTVYGKYDKVDFTNIHDTAPIHTDPNCPCRILDEQSGNGKSPKTYLRNADGFNKTAFGKGMGESSGKESLNYGDNGGASRYFKQIYCPKASRAERNRGLDSIYTVKYNIPKSILEEGILCQDVSMVVVQLLERVTSGLTLKWSIGESGESIMGQCPLDSLSIILMEINEIIESKILDLLMHLLTKDSIADANCEMENGGNHAGNVEDLKRWLLIITGGRMGFAHGVNHVAYEMLLKINEKENWLPLTNIHSTVKPIKLIKYLLDIFSKEGDLVLVPFAGSGSECVACKEMGRDFIGIEKDEEYCEIAERRLSSQQKTLGI